MILGVLKKSSRLGVIGELGRFPLFIKGVCHVLKYQAHLLKTVGNGSILSSAVQEMQSSPDLNLNSWWGMVSHIKEKLGIKYSKFSKLDVIGHNLKKQIKGKFETFWLDEIRKEKLGVDNVNHNKLRYYSSIKGCFKKEPYLDLVPNRSQRADLTRLRISSSRLATEVLRYKRPKVPFAERFCQYCCPAGADNNLEGYIDTEEHFLTSCNTFTLERNCLSAKLETVVKGYKSLSPAQQSATLLCPTNVVTAKLSNKYIQLIFQIRKNLDEGVPALNIGVPGGTIYSNMFFDETDET